MSSLHLLHLVRRAAAVAASAVALSITPDVVAAQDPKPPSREFATDLGFVNTAGNSEVTTFNLEERLILRANRWEHRQKFGAVYGSIDGEQSSNLVFANWRSNLALNAWLSVYGLVGFDRNQFAGISRRFEESAGLAAKVLRSGADHLDVELGLALNQQRSTDGSTLNFTSLRSATTYKHDFSKSAYFLQLAEFLPSLETGEDCRINSESSLVAPLSTHVAVKVGYVVRFDNLPEPGRRRSDRIFTTGLQFHW